MNMYTHTVYKFMYVTLFACIRTYLCQKGCLKYLPKQVVSLPFFANHGASFRRALSREYAAYAGEPKLQTLKHGHELEV